MDDFAKGRNKGAIAGFLKGAGQAGAGAGGGGGSPPSPPSPPPFTGPGALASRFDGLVDRGDRSTFISIADIKQITKSFWLKMNDQDGESLVVLRGFDTVQKLSFARNADNAINFVGKNTAGTNILRGNNNTNDLFTVASGWTHFMMSANLATGQMRIYVHNVEDEDVISTIVTDDFMDLTLETGGWGYGAHPGGLQELDADISEYYLSLEYVDLDDADERAKIIDPTTLKPVDLNADGSGITGSQPLIYFPDGNPTNNMGYGGDMILTGSVEAVDGPGVP